MVTNATQSDKDGTTILQLIDILLLGNVLSSVTVAEVRLRATAAAVQVA